MVWVNGLGNCGVTWNSWIVILRKLHLKPLVEDSCAYKIGIIGPQGKLRKVTCLKIINQNENSLLYRTEAIYYDED